MTREEFARLGSIINSTMGKSSFLANQDVEDTFWNFCLRYPYDVCRKAVLDIIENEAYDPEGHRVPLSLYIVERKIEREHRILKAQEKKHDDTKVCPNCGNNGYIIVKYPAGAEYFHACSCSIGRDKYPWYFMTPEQRRNSGDEGNRRSWASYDAYRAPDEYHRAVKYGE